MFTVLFVLCNFFVLYCLKCYCANIFIFRVWAVKAVGLYIYKPCAYSWASFCVFMTCVVSESVSEDVVHEASYFTWSERLACWRWPRRKHLPGQSWGMSMMGRRFSWSFGGNGAQHPLELFFSFFLSKVEGHSLPLLSGTWPGGMASLGLWRGHLQTNLTVCSSETFQCLAVDISPCFGDTLRS